MSDDKINAEKLLGFETGENSVVTNNRDAILYALGIGYSSDPMKLDDLAYTYEYNDEFKVFPTYCTVLHRTDLLNALTACPGMPNFNPMMLLHGEQRNILLRPIKPDTTYVNKGKVANVADKGKGALLDFEITTFEKLPDGKLEPAFTNTISVFIRGLGGFGFKGKPVTHQIPAKPAGQPNKVFEQKTEPNQAIIYRLSGDYNPLHIDPNMAALGGFDKPILHGLCTYGIAAKAIVQTFCGGNGNLLKGICGRFTSHVFPGETLIVSLWQDNNKITFSVKTKERGLEVLIGGGEIAPNPKL